MEQLTGRTEPKPEVPGSKFKHMAARCVTGGMQPGPLQQAHRDQVAGKEQPGETEQAQGNRRKQSRGMHRGRLAALIAQGQQAALPYLPRYLQVEGFQLKALKPVCPACPGTCTRSS